MNYFTGAGGSMKANVKVQQGVKWVAEVQCEDTFHCRAERNKPAQGYDLSQDANPLIEEKRDS